MKKIVSMVAVLMLLAVSLTLAGCGTKTESEDRFGLRSL